MESQFRSLQNQCQLADEARASEKRNSVARLAYKNADLERLKVENNALKASTAHDTLTSKNLVIANLRHDKVAFEAKKTKLEAVSMNHDADTIG